jgi:hypothetical protein
MPRLIQLNEQISGEFHLVALCKAINLVHFESELSCKY